MSKAKDTAVCMALAATPFGLAGAVAFATAGPAQAGQCGKGSYSKGWRVDPKTGECIPPTTSTTRPAPSTTVPPTSTPTTIPEPTTVPDTVPIVTTVPSTVIVCDDVDPAFRAAISVPYVVEDCSVGTATSVARPKTPANKPNTLPATGTDGTRYLVVIGGLLLAAGYAVAKGAQVPRGEREG